MLASIVFLMNVFLFAIRSQNKISQMCPFGHAIRKYVTLRCVPVYQYWLCDGMSRLPACSAINRLSHRRSACTRIGTDRLKLFLQKLLNDTAAPRTKQPTSNLFLMIILWGIDVTSEIFFLVRLLSQNSSIDPDCIETALRLPVYWSIPCICRHLEQAIDCVIVLLYQVIKQTHLSRATCSRAECLYDVTLFIYVVF